jgi:serine/threonine-protein kinase
VYLGISRGPAGFNKLLVVKVLRHELSEDPEFLAMFLDEARLAARLNHANVVQTYEIGIDGGQHFIAMEYLEGQALSSLLRRRGSDPLPPSIHLKIISTAAVGLHYAHELSDFDGTALGVVHRDVSPQNVFVTYDGQVKIVDFGIAKAAGASSQTRKGVIKGKLRYMAPEQLLARPLDRRTDLFACGVMLWEALVGRRFGDGNTETEIAQQRMLGIAVGVREANPDVPEALAKICDRALAPDPDARYQTAAEFHSALEDAIEALYGRVSSEQIAAVVSAAFAEDRKKLHMLVDAQVKRADSLPPADFADLTLLAVGDSTPRSNSRMEVATVRPGAGRADPNDESLHGMAPIDLPEKRSAMRFWIGAAAVGLALVVSFGIRLYLSETPARALPAAVVSRSPARVASPTISVNVGVTPREATMTLDGSPLPSNPFHATLTKDANPHRIRATLAEFGTLERVVSFDANVELELELEATPSPTPGKASKVKQGPKPAKRKASNVIDDRDPYK